MSLPAVTTADINAQIVASVELELGQTVPVLPKAFVRVLAKVFAAAMVLLYKYVGAIFLQLFVATASGKATTVNGRTVTPLHEWGKLVGVGLPVAAVPAELDLTVTVNTPGGNLPAGTQMVSEANGVTYLTSALVAITAGTITVPVTASADQSGGDGSGVIGNLQDGATVSFAQPYPGLQQDAVVDSTTVTGADGEAESNYRQRVIDRFQKQPQGGALADYEAWAEETAGIIAAYPYAGDPGEVNVYCEATVASSGNADGIPTASQLTAVLDSINTNESGRATRRQVNAFVTALPITRKPFQVRVNGLEVEDDAQVKADIEAALASTFASFEPFIGGLSIYRRDRVTRSEVAGVVHSVVAAAGGTFTSVLLFAQPSEAVPFSSQIVASADDAVEAAGVVTLADLQVTMGGADQYVGLRFDAVTLPAGAVITSARIDVESDTLDLTYSDFTIQGEADAASAAFTTGANDISNRARTVASVSWQPPGWAADTVYQSPDITPILEEIRGIAGWSSGDPMTLIITGTDDSQRVIKTFDDDISVSAQLVLAYTIDGVDYVTTELYSLAEGQKAKLDSVIFG